MNHYDYVLQPNGYKKKIFSFRDIEQVLDTWSSYIEKNWISPQNKQFDPESKVKFMLEGLANILLRNHMDGILTEYKKLKIGKYEFPFSSCASLFNDEIYSEYRKQDNGDEEYRLNEQMAEFARKYDEAKAAKTKAQPKKKKPHKITRRQKIEALRGQYGVERFTFERVDTENVFIHDGKVYKISDEEKAYAAKDTPDGDRLYDMDQILCADLSCGEVLFFDMAIAPVKKIFLVSEKIS